MQTSAPPRFYLPELDGLRFIAFMLVFIHNAPSISSSKIWTLLHEYGWIGVDLFFCLSAYLITKLLATEINQTGTINVSRFYLRRVLRIWPLYFLFIGIVLLSPSLLEKATDNRLLQFVGLGTFTFNFVLVHIFPFAIPAIVHLWTISFEEQFYLVIPFVIRKVAVISTKSVWVFLILIFLLGSLIRAAFIFFQIKHPAVYVLPFTRFESILGGMAVGLGLFDRMTGRIQKTIFMLCGTLLLFPVFFLPNVNEISWTLMLTYLFVGVGMSLILFSTMDQQNSFLNHLLSNQVLVYLGKISFGLYIFHLLGIRFATEFLNSLVNGEQGEVNAISVFVVGLVFTMAWSALSYRFYESPFLRLKRKFSVVASRPI